MNRNVFFERNVAILARGDQILDALPIPAQDMDGEFPRVLDPDAAVTEGAHILREQLLRGRVMHVDIVRIGKQELDSSQRIVISWRLPDREGNLAAIGPPVD